MRRKKNQVYELNPYEKIWYAIFRKEEEGILVKFLPKENKIVSVLTEEGKWKIKIALATLTPREQEILRMRLGIGEFPAHTLAEVASRFGVSREYIRQIVAKALRKLRDLLQSEYLDHITISPRVLAQLRNYRDEVRKLREKVSKLQERLNKIEGTAEKESL